MKKIISILVLGVAILTFAFSGPALAEGNPAAGKAAFGTCAACHAGGRNVVAGPSKALTKQALEANGMYSVEKIVYQITNGKGAMPPFRSLGDKKINDLAAYVLDQAEKGW